MGMGHHELVVLVSQYDTMSDGYISQTALHVESKQDVRLSYHRNSERKLWLAKDLQDREDTLMNDTLSNSPPERNSKINRRKTRLSNKQKNRFWHSGISRTA